MHNCSTIPDLRPNFYKIEKDAVNTYYALYMYKQYGVEVGYNTVPWKIASMRYELATWQKNNDCGALCSGSTF
jgi:hypothetical protein